ncbi:MAG: GTPase, partial [Bacilli bacterium]
MFFNKPKNSGFTAEIRVRRCYGCGAILQDTDPNEVGFIPSEKLNSEEEMLCERCYKLRHYSSYSKSPDFNVDYMTILSKAKETQSLAVYVINAFCLNGSFLEGIGKYLPDNVLVVINKRDCLPEKYSDEFIINQVKAKLALENIKPKDIIITSAGASNTSNISNLMKKISSLRNGKSVYFLGAYQVGKSSIINCLLMDYSNSTEKMITTSPYPGTTLDVISIPLDENSYMYDTPGIYNKNSFVSFIEPELVKYILPRNMVRPEMYQAKEGQSFVISNFFRLDFISGDKTDFTFYKSNDLSLLRCKV